MAEPILFLNSGRRALFMGSDKIHRAKSGKGKTCQKSRRHQWSSARAHILGIKDDILSKESWLVKRK